MREQNLVDKVAIITGAASGIGWSSVHLFLEAGAKIVGIDLNQKTADALHQSIVAKGYQDSFRMCIGNVAEEADVVSAVDLAKNEFGRVDIMFNNAAVGGAFGPITETSVEHWDETFAINMRGVFLGTKHAAKAMLEQGDGGSIINTASVAGLTGSSGPSAYSATKAGVINLTKNSAIELGTAGIRVNVICPGLIFTPIIGDEEKATAQTQKLQALKTKGTPEDIANAALFLASQDSAFITGQSIVVDGGYTIHGGLFGRAIGDAGMVYGTTGRKPEIRKSKP